MAAGSGLLSSSWLGRRGSVPSLDSPLRWFRNRITLGLENAAQGANGAVGAVVRQQRTAYRAGSFGRGCRDRTLLSARMLPRLVCSASRKIVGSPHQFRTLTGAGICPGEAILVRLSRISSPS